MADIYAAPQTIVTPRSHRRLRISGDVNKQTRAGAPSLPTPPSRPSSARKPLNVRQSPRMFVLKRSDSGTEELVPLSGGGLASLLQTPRDQRIRPASARDARARGTISSLPGWGDSLEGTIQRSAQAPSVQSDADDISKPPETVFDRLTRCGTASSSRRVREQRRARRKASQSQPPNSRRRRKRKASSKRPPHVTKSGSDSLPPIPVGVRPAEYADEHFELITAISSHRVSPSRPKSFRVTSLGIDPSIPPVVEEQEDEDSDDDSELPQPVSLATDSAYHGHPENRIDDRHDHATEMEVESTTDKFQHYRDGESSSIRRGYHHDDIQAAGSIVSAPSTSRRRGIRGNRRHRSSKPSSSSSSSKHNHNHNSSSNSTTTPSRKASSPHFTTPSRKAGRATSPWRTTSPTTITLGDASGRTGSDRKGGSTVSGSVGQGSAALPLSPSRSLGQVSVSRLDATRLTPLGPSLLPKRPTPRRPKHIGRLEDADGDHEGLPEGSTGSRRFGSAGYDSTSAQLPVTVGSARTERRRAQHAVELLRARVRKLEAERAAAERRASLMGRHESAVAEKEGTSDGLAELAEQNRIDERRRIAQMQSRNKKAALDAAERRRVAQRRLAEAAAADAARIRSDNAAAERRDTIRKISERRRNWEEAESRRRKLMLAAIRRKTQAERRRVARRDEYEMAIVDEVTVKQSAEAELRKLAEQEKKALEGLMSAQAQETSALTSLSERSGAHWRSIRRRNGLNQTVGVASPRSNGYERHQSAHDAFEEEADDHEDDVLEDEADDHEDDALEEEADDHEDDALEEEAEDHEDDALEEEADDHEDDVLEEEADDHEDDALEEEEAEDHEDDALASDEEDEEDVMASMIDAARDAMAQHHGSDYQEKEAMADDVRRTPELDMEESDMDSDGDSGWD